jgi:hypothetical protein
MTERAAPTTEIWSDTRGFGPCRSCGARLEWAELVKGGKRMPFNSPIVALKTRHDPDTGRVIETVDLSTNHFANCPQGKEWSRGRK